MKLISFKRHERAGFGAVIDGRVIDLTGRISGAQSIKELLEAGAVARAREYCQGAAPDFALQDCSLLPVIPNPNKIICIGVNYTEHANEAGIKAGTEYPVIFLRLPEVLIGHRPAADSPQGIGTV